MREKKRWYETVVLIYLKEKIILANSVYSFKRSRTNIYLSYPRADLKRLTFFVLKGKVKRVTI